MVLDTVYGNAVPGQIPANVRYEGADAVKIGEEAEGPIDKRAARTRAALKRALIAMTLERGYEAITISDLCEAAGVSRSTFYSHFTSKDDLKRSGLQQLRRMLTTVQAEGLASVGSAADRLSFGPALFEHARGHRDLFRALSGGPGMTIALDSIHAIIAELVRKELPPAPGADPVPRELAARFIAGAYLSVLTWWLEGRAHLPPARIEALCRALALDGLPNAVVSSAWQEDAVVPDRHAR